MLSNSRRALIAAAITAVSLALAACDTMNKPVEVGPSATDLASHARDPDGNPIAASPEAPPPTAAATASSTIPEPPPPEIVRGTGRLTGHSVPHVTESTVGEDGGITLNFINADVRDVAKAIFGDFLNVNYAIGAGVQGTITVQTAKPVARDQVLSVFEQILRLNGLAIVKNSGIYKIVLSADAAKEVTAPASTNSGIAEAGYGSQVVPLHYVAAAEMQRLLEGMQPAQAIVHADIGRNLLVIQGTQAERAAILDEVALFDVDWLAGMSFGMFTPKYTDAKGLVKELTQVLGGAGGPLAGIVKLVPIERLNTVLVISPQPRYLDQMQRWIARLDRPGVGSDRRIFVYAVQNGRASDLAATLKKVLYGGNGGGKATDSGGTTPTDTGDTTDHTSTAPPPAAGTAPAPPPSPGGSTGLIDDADNSTTPAGAATITADESNNAVVIYGTPQEYATIESALRQLDAAPLQVLLEAAIAEVTLTNSLKFGVQYFYQPNGTGGTNVINGGPGNSSSVSLTAGASALPSQIFPGFSYMFSQGSNIRVVLNTLSQVTRVQVVSSPEILVLNNHTATLQVGDQVPIATAQAQSVVNGQSPIINAIEYRDTGVILKVTPRVNQGGMVTMDITQEVSDVNDTATTVLDSPTITQRKINSTIAVQDNETIALGGLIKDDKTVGSSGLPFLSEIPVLGGLFGTKTHSTDRTELIVLITPHVVDNLQRARGVTDELRRKLPLLQSVLDKR
ncbi:MAG TPA: type II secretion system secretin GspD [Rhizomicrobium sp.]|nr:type II secretion system secretin GspD [Rhizomicrobium sp.]